MVKDSYQFSVTLTVGGLYKIIAQDYKEIIRSYNVSEDAIEQALVNELNALRPIDGKA